MLYITTRSSTDVYTAYRALHEDLAPGGDCYVPFRLPSLDSTEIAAMEMHTFGENVARILNLFFSARLSGWDVDCCIGRNVCRIVSMNHRISVAELWHNLGKGYSYIVDSLYKKMSGIMTPATDWAKIAIRIAVLFSLYAQMRKEEIITAGQALDISVPAEGFFAPIAAWYARAMGLPIGMIICTCEEDNPVWDMIHRGVFNSTAADNQTLRGIGRLIQATLGSSEAETYWTKCQNQQSYSVSPDSIATLNAGFFCAVAGANRAEAIINSLYRSNAYASNPKTALCYGGLQDYRAKVGDSRMTLILAEQSPETHN